MNLFIANGHIVVPIDGVDYLIDTGLSCSFSFCGIKKIEINGECYTLGEPYPKFKEMADELTGRDISGFIGTDILFKTGITVDYENKNLEFIVPQNMEPTPDFYMMPIDIYDGQYIVTDNIMFGDHLRRTVIDTGAFISYVSSRHIHNFVETEEAYEDQNPTLGRISGNFYVGEISFNSMAALNFKHPVKVGKMPRRLDMQGTFDAIIGPDLLSRKYLAFDFNRMIIGMKYDGRK